MFFSFSDLSSFCRVLTTLNSLKSFICSEDSGVCRKCQEIAWILAGCPVWFLFPPRRSFGTRFVPWQSPTPPADRFSQPSVVGIWSSLGAPSKPRDYIPSLWWDLYEAFPTYAPNHCAVHQIFWSQPSVSNFPVIKCLFQAAHTLLATADPNSFPRLICDFSIYFGPRLSWAVFCAFWWPPGHLF